MVKKLFLEWPCFFSTTFLILKPDNLDTYYFYLANLIYIYNGMSVRISKIHCTQYLNTQHSQHHRIMSLVLSLFYKDSCFKKWRNFMRPFVERFLGNDVIILAVSFSYNICKCLLWQLRLGYLPQSLQPAHRLKHPNLIRNLKLMDFYFENYKKYYLHT